jgi:ATP-dependent Clp protease adaptor protein ClpS
MPSAGNFPALRAVADGSRPPTVRLAAHLAGTSVASTMPLEIAPVEVDRPKGDESVDPDRPWVVIVWNDPINLMAYVTYVLQKLFGYPLEVAEKLMLQVHYDGKAVVSNGTREKAELDVFRLHEHGLWATMQQD